MYSLLRFLFICIYLCCASMLMGQTYKYSGTDMPYDTANITVTPPPYGYQMITINHVGIHGSSYPISGEDAKYVLELIERAQQDEGLTLHGQMLLNQMQNYASVCADNWGFLSSLGRQQQQGIARRLVEAYGEEVFRSIKVWYDVKERCFQSGVYFLNEVKGLCGEKVNIIADILPVQNSLLNFFNVNPEYRDFVDNGSWKLTMVDYIAQELYDNKLLERYVKPGVTLTQKELIKFFIALYNCVAIAPNIPIEPQNVPNLGETVMQLGWRIQNVRQYLEKGPARGNGDIQVEISKPLLENFLLVVDSALTDKNFSAYLRFAHAETIIPFAALLGIPEASASTSVVDNICELWKDYVVSPMAANIIWTIYENQSGHRLVKMTLNEHEVPFPVEPYNYPYYDWVRVKQFYENILK